MEGVLKDIHYAVKSGDKANARLLNIEDLVNNLGYEYYEEGTSSGYRKTENAPNWISNLMYDYWTMIPYGDSNNIYKLGGANFVPVDVSTFYTIRPVLELSKSADITVINS